jgi:hypothetical protein
VSDALECRLHLCLQSSGLVWSKGPVPRHPYAQGERRLARYAGLCGQSFVGKACRTLGHTDDFRVTPFGCQGKSKLATNACLLFHGASYATSLNLLVAGAWSMQDR